MNDRLRETLKNLAKHSDEIIKQFETIWPADEPRSSVMERSDRLHFLASVRNMGISARRAAARLPNAETEKVPEVRYAPNAGAGLSKEGVSQPEDGQAP